MNKFLHSVVESLQAHYGAALQDVHVVVPTRRAAIYLHQICKTKLLDPASAPKLHSIDDWVLYANGQLSNCDSANKYTLLYHLFLCYNELLESVEPQNLPARSFRTFREFIPFGELIINDFDTLDRYVVDAEKLYGNMWEMEEIDASFATELALGNEHQLLLKSFNDQWTLLWDLYVSYGRRLDEYNITYSGRMYRSVAQRLSDGDDDANGVKFAKTVFVGLNAISKAEEMIFTSLHEQGIAEFIWDYDPLWLGDKFTQAAYFVSKNIKKFPTPDYFIPPASTATVAKIEVVSTPSDIVQCKVVGELLRSSAHLNNTAVVLTDESLLLPLLRSLPAELEGLNISMGFPMQYTDEGQFLSLLIDAHQRARHHIQGQMGEQIEEKASIDGGVEYPSDVLHALLALPFFASEQEPADTLSPYDSQELSPYFSPNTALHSARSLHAHFSDSVRHISAQLSSDETKEVSVERFVKMERFLNSLYEVFSQWGDEHLTVELYFEILRREFSHERVEFQGRSGTGLQIIGILESRALDFDNVILLSLQEGVFPNPTPGNSFIPQSFLNYYSLPTMTDRSAIWSFYFFRLLQYCHSASLLYCSTPTNSTTGEPSRYIQQLECSRHYSTTHSTVVIKQQDSSNTQTPPHATAKVVVPAHWQLTYASPSALNLYLNCPRAYYFRYVEKIEVPSIRDQVPNGADVGTLLHNLLQELYTPLLGVVNPPEKIKIIAQNKSLVATAYDKVFTDYYQGAQTPEPQMAEIVKAQVVAMAQRIMRYDAEDSSLDRIVALEAALSATFSGVRVGGRVDRIDMLKDGVLRVIDYKTATGVLTSASSVEQLFERRYLNEGKEWRSTKEMMQLLVYCAIIEESQAASALCGGGASGIAPAVFSPREISANSVKMTIGKESLQPISSDVLRSVSASLELLLGEMSEHANTFAQCVNQGACTYCDFSLICSR